MPKIQAEVPSTSLTVWAGTSPSGSDTIPNDFQPILCKVNSF
jgi:hypothetical protein